MSYVPRVPRMQVVTAHNQKLIAENDVHVRTIRGIREQLRGLNQRNLKLAVENNVLRARIRRQLRMLDVYRGTQGFRRMDLPPLHVAIASAFKIASEGVETAAETAALLDADVGAVEGTE